MSKKSLFVTYLLWLIGGLFGLHHFYLRRDRQALVWFMFAGGYFGLGWLRDFWKIPEYVKDANQDPDYVEELTCKMRKCEKPNSSTIRYCGQMLVADTFGYLTLSALPHEYIPDSLLPVSAVVVPFAIAVGVHLVGNIGHQCGDFKVPLIGAYLTYPLYFWIRNPVFYTSLTSSLFFNNFAKKWRRTPSPPKPVLYRIFILFVCSTLYLGLWGSWIYFNCNVTLKEGEEVKCREAARHFFTSPMWREFLSVMKDLYQYAKYNGWREVWHHIIHCLDPHGESNALKVLGLDSSATQQEITSSYRKLSRQWHPDKHRDPEHKAMVEEKFIEIQQAYEILSKIKSQRLARNKKGSEEIPMQSAE